MPAASHGLHVAVLAAVSVGAVTLLVLDADGGALGATAVAWPRRGSFVAVLAAIAVGAVSTAILDADGRPIIATSTIAPSVTPPVAAPLRARTSMYMVYFERCITTNEGQARSADAASAARIAQLHERVERAH